MPVSHPAVADSYARLSEVLPGLGITVPKAGEALPGGGGLGTIILRRPSVSLIDATLWASIGGAFLVVLLIAMWLRRRRMRPAQTYETWKPAKVVVVEPGTPPRKGL